MWKRQDYEALFDAAPDGTLRGESTPLYMYDPDAMGRIRDLIPDAKLIAVIRDPVERAHSNWTHLWSAGLEPIGNFVQACGEEERRIAAGWASFWHYTGLGRYGEQLEHIFTMFPREQVLVIRYRQLVDEPAATLDGIFDFLGVEQGLVTEVPRQNVTAQVTGGRHVTAPVGWSAPGRRDSRRPRTVGPSSRAETGLRAHRATAHSSPARTARSRPGRRRRRVGDRRAGPSGRRRHLRDRRPARTGWLPG